MAGAILCYNDDRVRALLDPSNGGTAFGTACRGRGRTREVGMYRSVTESQQGQTKKRKHIHWLEGIGIGLAVFLVLFFTFGWR